jgi:hypothetical protein
MKLNHSSKNTRKPDRVETHKVGEGYLLEVNGVLCWQIKLFPEERMCKLYRYDEIRGLVLTDSAPNVGDLVNNVADGSYAPVEPDHPLELHDL